MTNVNSTVLIRRGNDLDLDGHFRIIMDVKRSRYVHLFPLDVREADAASPDASRLTATGKKRREPVKKPVPIWRQQLDSALSQGRAKMIQLDENLAVEVPYDSLSKRQQEIYDTSEKILKPVISPDLLYDILENDKWAWYVSKVAAELAISEMQVRRVWSKYFSVGMNRALACTPKYRNSGRIPGSEREVTCKLGRPRKLVETGHAEDKPGVNSQGFIESIRVFYAGLRDKTLSNREMYKQYEQDFYAKFVTSRADGTLVKHRESADAFIEFKQFVYRLRQILTPIAMAKATIGAKKYLLKNRILTSDARDAIHYPGQVFIIDSTVADVYLVSRYDRSLLIGRPVVYVVIDAFSLLIVGIHVTLQGPSFEEAKVALYRSMSDKSAWLNWLGLEGLAHAFPQGCQPTFIFADRGELHSIQSRELAEELQTALSVAAPYRADWKSLVERYFKVLNDQIVHWIPGAVRSRAKERGERDVRFDAVLTLFEFTRIIAIECAIWNEYKNMSKYVTACMLPHKFEASPLSFWKWGHEYLHGSADFMSRESAIRQFVPYETARITRSGIFAEKQRYTAEWMVDHPTLVGKGLGIDADGIVFRDPDHPLQGYCQLEGEAELRLMQLDKRPAPEDREATYEDVVDIAEYNLLNGLERDLDVRPEVSALGALQRQIITDAMHDTEIAHQDNPQSKAQRVASVRENRRNEVAELGAEQIESAKSVEDGCIVSPPSESSENMWDDLITDAINQWGESP